jgi:succinate-semialdehyde dehydrogenase / glutarate-semialdehyde dehydrogenase
MVPNAVQSAGDYWEGRHTPGGLGREAIERLARLVAAGSGARAWFDVQAPFTGQPLGSVPQCTPEDVQEAVRRARIAQTAWLRQSLKQRAAVLLRFHDLVLARREQALDLIQLESGKTRLHALEEVLDTALVARHYAFHGAEYLSPRRRGVAIPVFTRAWEYRRPVGVAGFISPWNFPLILAVTDLLPALMAGNGAVLRPDSQSPFTALWAVSLLREAGLPHDLLPVVTGAGSLLGPPLIDAVDFIMFTGSTRTGKCVARQASERLIGFSLELGGKNPMIVLPDAGINAAVDGLARGAFVGAGQVCVSIERAYIPSQLFDSFSSRLVERVGKMRLSAALEYGADMGSLASAGQLATVISHVEDAAGNGARVLAGGRPRPDVGPLFYEPTVLAGVTAAMTVYAEETFGPVVSLYRYDNLEEAIASANSTPYGLNASVWSKDVRTAVEVGKRIQAGTVNVNETYASTWSATAAPIGGMKLSGFGRRHGAEGILKYTQAQTIAAQRWLPMGQPPFLSQRRYAKWISRLLRLMRRAPGLR